MKSKEIQKLFIEYMLGDRKKFKYATESESPAIIYGSDEFKIDKKRSRIKIEEMDWLEIEDCNLDCNLKNIEWIAIVCNEGVYSILISSIKNPFSESEDNPMYIDGQVFGIPASINKNFLMNYK